MTTVSIPTCRHGLLALLAASLLGAPLVAKGEVLYKLKTQCSLGAGNPRPCQVEAINEKGATLYRHTIGGTTETIRVTDQPVRMERWDAKTKGWLFLNSAAARFSRNTVCFNGRDLCVVNPNYLNSVQEDRPEAMAGRDLVQVVFGKDGRINLSCYDDGCQKVAP
jgi:hypothetical protein